MCFCQSVGSSKIVSPKIALDDSYMRWINAGDTGNYPSPSGVNGWLWLSTITVDALFVAKDTAIPVEWQICCKVSAQRRGPSGPLAL